MNWLCRIGLHSWMPHFQLQDDGHHMQRLAECMSFGVGPILFATHSADEIASMMKRQAWVQTECRCRHCGKQASP